MGLKLFGQRVSNLFTQLRTPHGLAKHGKKRVANGWNLPEQFLCCTRTEDPTVWHWCPPFPNRMNIVFWKFRIVDTWPNKIMIGRKFWRTKRPPPDLKCNLASSAHCRRIQERLVENHLTKKEREKGAVGELIKKREVSSVYRPMELAEVSPKA